MSQHHENTTTARAGIVRLYFGADVPSQHRARLGFAEIDETRFAAFVRDEIAPRFPGWTELRGSGGWLDATSGALVHERSRIVETFAFDLDETARAAREIAAKFCARFAQDAVALAVVPSEPVSFVSAPAGEPVAA